MTTDTSGPYQSPPEEVLRERRSPLLGQLTVGQQPTQAVGLGRAPSGVVRRPIVVVILTGLTFGIYFLYWWYAINREIADVGRAWGTPELGEQPLLSLLAMFPGCFVMLPPLVSFFGAVQRIKTCQRLSGQEVTMNGWIVVGLLVGSLVIILPILAVPWYCQRELNRVWASLRAAASVQ